ncbi:hypothetical protein ACFS5N_09995 [Mucilaginibacter ximonensis]|uniref:YceI-like domain-containing protein n=1 Tax=Mucilaginibacter ximonensis TaxID=538021 RepID=A0ABW5YCA4_9SPHI
MKKSIFAAAILLSVIAANAQNKIPFKFRLLPKHTYTVEGFTNIDSRINTLGQGNAMPKGGQAQKFENKGNVTMSYTIATGAPDAKGTFPFIITVNSFLSKNTINGKEQPGPQNNPVKGARSQGTITADGKMHTETITFVTADEKTTKAIVNMLNKFGDQIQFPARAMRVGESFTQDKPFNMANGGKNVDIKTTVTYTLKGIQGNLAFFNTKEVIVTNINAQKGGRKADVKTSGTGKGTMVYDIANGFAVSKTDNLTTQMNMTMGTMNMDINAVAAVSYKAKINAN